MSETPPGYTTNTTAGAQPLPPNLPVAGPPQIGPNGTLVQPVLVPVAAQPGMVQPVAVPQAPIGQTHPEEAAEHHHPADLPRQIFLYSHSMLFYWWPVWAVGFLMALITYFGGGKPEEIGQTEIQVLVYPSKNMGVIFTMVLLLVILITNVTLRGMASVVTILVIIIATLLLAYFEFWGYVLHALGRVEIYLNFGFYTFFSTAMFLIWAFAFFGYDRMVYWRFRPGQVTKETVIGGAEHSYDTRGMVFVKHQEDLFRHWILGLGSGDIEFTTTGARRENVYIPNVLFVNSRLQVIQRLIAIKPDTDIAPPQ